jgi:hypothetical protein
VTRTRAFSAAPRSRRAPARPPARALAAALGLALLALALLAAAPRPAAAQAGTLYFLTVKRGVQDASGSGETAFQTLESGGRGPLQGKRSVQTSAVELDIYGVSRDSAGLGIGMEVLQYDHTFAMQNGDRVRLRTKGVLFSFKVFLRLGDVFPFLGAGLGNYYVNYDENQSGVSFRDSPDSVYNARVGLRWLFGRLGLLLEAGNTHAQLPITTGAGPAQLELGGNYANAGLSWVF